MLAYAILTLLTYLTFLIFKANPLPHYLIWIISIFITTIYKYSFILNSFQDLASRLFRTNYHKLKFSNFQLLASRFLPSLPLLGLFLLIATVLSILIRPINIEGHQFLGFTSSLDYYKHSYTITAIRHQGLPPVHPYAPATNMSYYYGYYLIPASLSLILPLPQTTILYLYVLTTTALALTFLYKLYIQYLTRWWTRFLAFTFLVIGGGWDIIPTLKLDPGFMNYIELWAHANNLGLAINNTSTAFLWVPQHIIAATLGLYTINYLLHHPPTTHELNAFFTRVKARFWPSSEPDTLNNLKSKLTSSQLLASSFMITLLYTTLLFTSLFVSFTILFWTLLIFLWKPNTRKPLILAALLSLPFLLPFATHLGTRNSTFIQTYTIQPLTLIDHPQLNYLWNIVIEYGPLFFLSPLIILILTIKNYRKYILPIILSLAPFFWILLFRSPNANDFSMRTILPLQLLFPLIYMKLTELALKDTYTHKLISRFSNLSKPSKTPNLSFSTSILLLLLLVSLLGTLPGTFYEYKHRWSDRTIIDPFETELHLSLQQLPHHTTIFAPATDNWVFNIPVLSGIPVISPSLFDAGVYVSHSTRNLRPIEEIFLRPTRQPDLETLISFKQNQLNQASKILQDYPSEYVILNRQIGPKQGINPWDYIFSQTAAPHTNINTRYSLWNTLELIHQLNRINIQINTKTPLQTEIIDHQFKLPPGLWYLTTCSEQSSTHIKLEFEDHYRLFDQPDFPSMCIGQLFYHQHNQPLRISNGYTIHQLIAYPVTINL